MLADHLPGSRGQMPNLYIYVPFPRATKSDIKSILEPLGADADTPQLKAVNGLINAVTVIFWGEEHNIRVQSGDTLLVNAHGGDGNYTNLCDNSGGEIAVAQLMQRLTAIGAPAAKEVIFYCCYSAQANHIAKLYKASHANQTVYGSPTACAGSDLYSNHSGGRQGRALTFQSPVWQTHSGLELM
jgi:hypothetical protein